MHSPLQIAAPHDARHAAFQIGVSLCGVALHADDRVAEAVNFEIECPELGGFQVATCASLSLPSKVPELNPVENILHFMRDNWPSSRIFGLTIISSTSAAKPRTHLAISLGASCPANCATGVMHDRQCRLV